MEILSQMWSFLGLLTVLQNVLPSQLLSLLHSLWQSVQDALSPCSYFEIPEFNGYSGVDVNDLYRMVHLYLNSLDPTASCPRLTLTRPKNSTRISYTVSPNHTLQDSFEGHALWWTHHVETVQDSLEEKRSFSLKLPKRQRKSLLPKYLAAVAARAMEFERVSRERLLYTNARDHGWASVPFCHPSTFETLALEPELKEEMKRDLTAFVDGQEFYRRVGRAWKRGYLLYGPPGSGKSSLIAAIANYLRYDVYDLELTKVSDNSELRELLIQTTNRSIIVIEDIDCSLDLTGDRHMLKTKRSEQRSSFGADDGEDGRVTLSGLLNFTDGLWSCCGEERIIVFTTNHIDNVDPALIRHGRMDVHVQLGTCGYEAFKILARNYLGLAESEEHVLHHVVESCIRAGGALTPAEIGEILLRNRQDTDTAMREVVAALQGNIVREERLTATATESDDTGRSVSDLEELLLEDPSGSVRIGGKRRKVGSSWERKVRFLAKLKGLTKSDSGKRGV
ncbi:AAA-ATPase At4g25835-like [Aristolochia californica]|uniref:AAA-ATPase At4g25835-like n=1 Tax=Aristolochia californica TaxID=171875 RepID=UPI0035DB0217